MALSFFSSIDAKPTSSVSILSTTSLCFWCRLSPSSSPGSYSTLLDGPCGCAAPKVPIAVNVLIVIFLGFALMYSLTGLCGLHRASPICTAQMTAPAKSLDTMKKSITLFMASRKIRCHHLSSYQLKPSCLFELFRCTFESCRKNPRPLKCPQRPSHCLHVVQIALVFDAYGAS